MDPACKKMKLEDDATSIFPNIADSFLLLEKQLNEQLSSLTFSGKVTCIYKPIEYAFETHSDYVRKYLNSTKDVLFVGMNPGPFGMVQTGVPFGEVSIVKEWLQIVGNVGKPEIEHPKRKVVGFSCTRNEVSGQRFWSLFKDLCQTPEKFFRYAFVHNYCPLVFMAESGKNVTPTMLLSDERRAMHQLCSKNICEVIKLLRVKYVIAIGKYTYDQIKEAVQNENFSDLKVDFIMHPSPINPEANKAWKPNVIAKFQQLDLLHYFTP